MQKSMVEKLHDKVMKIIDNACYGKQYYSVRISKVSETEYDMDVVAEDMIAAALFDAQKPLRYSKSHLAYSNKKSKEITYEGKPNCWKVSAHITMW